ncbi:hypothetical protein ABZ860_14335 [Microbispora sp. NPDC046973]
MLCGSRASRAGNCSRSSGDGGARSDPSPRLYSRDRHEADAFWDE